MIDRWWRQISFPVTWDQFHELPQHAAYKKEYIDRELLLTPREKYFCALLELESAKLDPPKRLPRGERIRALREDDWDNLDGAFATAFWRVAPFDSLSPKKRLEAARDCLQHTRSGGDGPLVKDACFVCNSEVDKLIAGILITLVPNRSLSDSRGLRWDESPPPDCVEKHLGRPHLTWIFVHGWMGSHGIGTALLARAVARLREMGFSDLASTVMSHDDASLLWHWRCGFELQSRPFSWRLRDLQKLIPDREVQ